MGGALQSVKTRNWDTLTLESLVQTIAAEYGLKSAVAQTLNVIAYDRDAQTKESDINQRAKLAEPLDAIAASSADDC